MTINLDCIDDVMYMLNYNFMRNPYTREAHFRQIKDDREIKEPHDFLIYGFRIPMTKDKLCYVSRCKRASDYDDSNDISIYTFNKKPFQDLVNHCLNNKDVSAIIVSSGDFYEDDRQYAEIRSDNSKKGCRFLEETGLVLHLCVHPKTASFFVESKYSPKTEHDYSGLPYDVPMNLEDIKRKI